MSQAATGVRRSQAISDVGLEIDDLIDIILDDDDEDLFSSAADDDDILSSLSHSGFESSDEDDQIWDENDIPSGGQAASHEDLKRVVTSKIPSHQLDEKCSVCLAKYKQGETVSALPCKHIFHDDCIQSWFRNNDSCPLCRARLGQTTIHSKNEAQ